MLVNAVLMTIVFMAVILSLFSSTNLPKINNEKMMSAIVRSHFSNDLRGSIENMELMSQQTNMIVNVIIIGEENDSLTKPSILFRFG